MEIDLAAGALPPRLLPPPPASLTKSRSTSSEEESSGETNLTPQSIIDSISRAESATGKQDDDNGGNDDDGSSDSDNDSDGDGKEQEGVKRWMVNDPTPQQPRTESQKKRADIANFGLWVEENSDIFSKGADKPSVGDGDGFLPAKYLVTEGRVHKIINSPREYQIELFEKAKQENTIAVLDTGSGKTLIAALLLRWAIEQELAEQAAGQPKRIAFFLVDKVALVFQQHSVFANNLDYPVEKFCGEMVDRIWSQALWARVFAKNMAVVCTADILYKCLHHAFISMDQISLLIFDEAHHTKKNHPYARILKDFYVPDRDTARRPRIFGMTASPVDSKENPEKAAAELEGLLHSRIATTTDPAALKQTICRPKEETVVEYDRMRAGYDTPLLQSLRAILVDHDQFGKAFSFAKHAAAELGPWVADRFLQLYFRDEDAQKLEAKAEMGLVRLYAADSYMDKHIKEVREACELVRKHVFVRDLAGDKDLLLSSKVRLLLQLLTEKVAGNSTAAERRCIVFVEQRNTAMMLVDLLRQPDMAIPGLRTGVLIGSGRTESGYNTSYKDQMRIVRDFRLGQLNCIFATSVGEEGLDIPDCNIIIRFDLYKTMIQYIQSRGRARQEKSEYIHMIEKGNRQHFTMVRQSRVDEDQLRRFCEALPEDRKLSGNDFDMDYFLRKEKAHRHFTVPSTGARLNYKQSLVCLAMFVASLPHPPETALVPEYIVTPAPGGFRCEVLLPSVSPVRSVMGQVHRTKAVAKCSAAFETCLELFKGHYLDDHLQPVFTKQLPAMRNARLAISVRKKDEYPMRVKPAVWSARGAPTELHIMALTLATPNALDRPSVPLLLLSRQALIRPAPFPLFFSTDRASDVCCVPLPGSLKLDVDGDDDKTLVECITKFTLRIFKDVFSKEYAATAADLPYFLAPTMGGHDFDFSAPVVADIRQVLDMATLELVRTTERIKCQFDEPDDFFTDKYATDPWDGSRKFFLRGRRHDMKPRDPVPEGVVAPSHRAWKTCKERDILNYSVSLWSKSRQSKAFREDQPVVEAEVLPIRRNLLDESIVDEDLRPKRCFLVLEPLDISPLPVRVVAMAYTFPVIMHRIEANLIAMDACRMLGLDEIRPDLALEALTKDSDNSDEHEADVERINFQGGMGSNYERLEFLGDCFLKMATTISVYTLIPDRDEFEYHVERMLMVCNKNLFNNALELKLEEYVRSRAFDRRSWYPDGLTLVRGKRAPVAQPKHTLADKSIADVCEALIGAAYITGTGVTDTDTDTDMDTNTNTNNDSNDIVNGHNTNTTTSTSNSSFDLAIRAVSAVVRDKKHNMTAWPQYYALYQMPAWQTAPAAPQDLDMAARFATRMGYRFRHPRLLRCAFMHPSFPSRTYYGLPSYQRLEFLGDALLDMACVDHLFRHFPGADPQWLTEHKMAMVSNQFLGCLAVRLRFHRSLMTMSPAIQREVRDYVTALDDALHAARAGNNSNSNNNEENENGDDRSSNINNNTKNDENDENENESMDDNYRDDDSNDDDDDDNNDGNYPRNYWVHAARQPPKCLPDTVEAYIGAVFVDSGYDYGEVRRFFEAHVRPFFVDMRIYDTYAQRHPVTFLATRMAQHLKCSRWRLLVKETIVDGAGVTISTGDGDDDKEKGGIGGGGGGGDSTAYGTPQVVCGFTVHGRTRAYAVAASGRYAKIAAAKRAMALLDGLSREEFRVAYGCDCVVGPDDASKVQSGDGGGVEGQDVEMLEQVN